ncbi:MAG: hypothetical protein ACLGSD_02280 [Acidobacteriota bacterium]
MQAVIETKEDGSVALELDREATRAMIASIVFAARFHEGIAPLAAMVEASLERSQDCAARGALCQ